MTSRRYEVLNKVAPRYGSVGMAVVLVLHSQRICRCFTPRVLSAAVRESSFTRLVVPRSVIATTLYMGESSLSEFLAAAQIEENPLPPAPGDAAPVQASRIHVSHLT